MTANSDKFDDAVLALLHLTSFREGTGEFVSTRTWKGRDENALKQLCANGSAAIPASILAKSASESENHA